MKISILMLTHNAPKYVYHSIIDVSRTRKIAPFKLIVVDNASNRTTKLLLRFLKITGKIDRLKFNQNNELFARGNNTAASIADQDTTHYLLLNSDIKVMSPDWLKSLIDIHSDAGISAYGAVLTEPVRADGYCMLIDKWLYDKYLLDENFAWFWSVTKLESHVLKEGLKIRAVLNHEELLHHYGGKSGNDFTDAKGMDADINDILKWFEGKKQSVQIIDSLSTKDQNNP